MDQMVFLHPKTFVYIAAICRLILRQANVTAKKGEPSSQSWNTA